MNTFQTAVRASLAVAAAAFWYDPALAVEGGSGAYLPGSRDTLAGIAPPPGSYFTIDVFHLDSTAPFLPIHGLVLSDITSSVTVTKLNFTHSFAAPLWGGQPYVTLTVPLDDLRRRAQRPAAVAWRARYGTGTRLDLADLVHPERLVQTRRAEAVRRFRPDAIPST